MCWLGRLFGLGKTKSMNNDHEQGDTQVEAQGAENDSQVIEQSQEQNQNQINTMSNKKTNLGLIEYCKAQLGRPYWYGTFGQQATAYILRYNSKRFPQYYKDNDFESQIGMKVHDCIGLIKGYFWSKDADDMKPIYLKGFPDVSADVQYDRSKKKGNSIATLPEVPGVLVFMKGHVGVYMGDGKVIEARGHKFGVVVTELGDRPWVKWAYVDELEYV